MLRACCCLLFFTSLLFCWPGQAQTSAVAPGTPYVYREQVPIFPGGDSTNAQASFLRFKQFLQDSLKLPPLALRDQVSGRVLLAFAVTPAGRTTELKIVQGLRADVDSAVLRHARRLQRVQWQPGTQQGRPVRVAFTVPLSINLPKGTAAPDSLDLPRFHKARLPASLWSLRHPVPGRQGIIYGSCVPRPGGGSGGQGHYVRVVNLTTGQVFRLPVKPAMHLQREYAFYYPLPSGRYALSEYEWGQPTERLARRLALPGPTVAATRYVFRVEAGQLNYVGTWNLARPHEPLFLDEKAALDALLQPESTALHFADARRAIPH